MKLVIFIASVVCLAARIVKAGECCRAYTNLFVSESAKYCSDYCCGDSSIKLECCSNIFFLAPSDERTTFCADWFISPENVWAPILMGLAFVAGVVGLCCCCYEGCFKTKTRGTVMPQQQGMPNTQIFAVSGPPTVYPGHYPPPGQGPNPSAAGYNPPGQGHPPPGYYPPGTSQQSAGTAEYPPKVDASVPGSVFQES